MSQSGLLQRPEKRLGEAADSIMTREALSITPSAELSPVLVYDSNDWIRPGWPGRRWARKEDHDCPRRRVPAAGHPRPTTGLTCLGFAVSSGLPCRLDLDENAARFPGLTRFSAPTLSRWTAVPARSDSGLEPRSVIPSECLSCA